MQTPHFIGETDEDFKQYGIDLIKHFEGCELLHIKCPAGVWTIGYGHTKDVQPGDEWSEDHANHMLEVELEEYENYVSKQL